MTTEAEFFTSLKDRNLITLNADIWRTIFNVELSPNDQSLLSAYDGPSKDTPELPDVQNFMNELFSKLLVDDQLYWADLNSYRSPSFGTRKPDNVIYKKDCSGPLAIVLFCENKGRYSDKSFSAQHCGHCLDMARELMETFQPRRRFVFCFLSDGYRFQFFRVYRNEDDDLRYDMSLVYLGKCGLQVNAPFCLCWCCTCYGSLMRNCCGAIELTDAATTRTRGIRACQRTSRRVDEVVRTWPRRASRSVCSPTQRESIRRVCIVRRCVRGGNSPTPDNHEHGGIEGISRSRSSETRVDNPSISESSRGIRCSAFLRRTTHHIAYRVLLHYLHADWYARHPLFRRTTNLVTSLSPAVAHRVDGTRSQHRPSRHQAGECVSHSPGKP